MWWRRRWRGLKNPDSQSMCAKTPEEYFHDFVSSCRLFTLQKSRNSVAMGVEGGTAEKFQTANLCVFPWRSGAKTPLGLYVCDWRLAENKCSVSLCFLLPRRVQSRKLCRTNTCLEGSKRVSEASHVRLVEKISHISKTCFWIREVGVVKKGGEDYYVSPDS